MFPKISFYREKMDVGTLQNLEIAVKNKIWELHMSMFYG
ncbi:hypothetical protein LEP1GSC018_3360 [Leptospira kirschneri str. 2008720114]|nr:hypothetical protein LEP1GSC018_3360 [Leptospira kirschneri str. 2008720114]